MVKRGARRGGRDSALYRRGNIALKEGTMLHHSAYVFLAAAAANGALLVYVWLT